MTTLHTLLFGEDRSAHALGPLLPEVLNQRLPAGVGIDDLPAQVTAAIVELLTMPLGNLALVAWDKHRQVRAACEQTAQQPYARQVVRLVEHTIRSEQHPVIDLHVNGTTHRLLSLTLLVELLVGAANIVVERGRVGEVHPVGASAAATLSAGRVKLAHGAIPDVDLRRS